MPVRAHHRGPRTLAEDLRSRDDDALAALLQARPDLATPVPGDLTALAARASTRASAARALETLDTPTLQVAEAMAALGAPTTGRELTRVCGARVEPQVGRLRELALVWGPASALRLVRAVAAALGPHPGGLGPPLADLPAAADARRVAAWVEDLDLDLAHRGELAGTELVAAFLRDATAVQALVGAAPAPARELLERLSHGSPVGAVARADRIVRAATADSPVDWLLARALLVPADTTHVVVPAEVGMALRGGRVHEHLDAAPSVVPRQVRADVADGAAAVAAAEAVRLVEGLGDLWGAAPASVLRSGGLGVRELRRVAASLEVSSDVAALVVEIAYIAGLVAQDGQPGPTWCPTPDYDGWAATATAVRWRTLARAWLGSSRSPSLVGSRDSRGTVALALSDAVEWPAVATVRHDVLQVLADGDRGWAPEPADVAEVLRWRRPRGPQARNPALLPAVLAEAEWLGVTGMGMVSRPGLALASGSDPAAALQALLPEPVEHVLLQADLTAVAPGPLTPEVARELAMIADVDSRGGATVYRFDAATIRRGLDAGRTGDDLVAFLAEHSRTPLPQALGYLVADTARRHGRVRVGSAGAYLRADDEALLAELLADRRTAVLRLRRIAPTVLTAQADPATVLETLRSIGHAPGAEAMDGTLLLRRPDVRRTGPRRPPASCEPPGPGPQLARAVVAAMRAGEAATSAGRGPDQGAPPRLPAMGAARSMATLRAAAAGRRRVWVGLADPDGRVRPRLVEPLSVDGGRVMVLDHGTAQVHALAIHRVTGVVDAAPPPPDDAVATAITE